MPIVNENFEIIFEGVLGSNKGDISIDDIYLTQGKTCEELSLSTQQPTTTALKPVDECDFEVNFCSWDASIVGNLPWQRRNGSNAVFGLAPFIDHTLESPFGVYAFVNSNSLSQLTEKAILRSQTLIWNQEMCYEFWYQLSGPSASTLSITLRNNTAREDLWIRRGNVADDWKHVYVRIPENKIRHWIDVEG